MKLIQIVGARPQFIKYYPLSLAIERHNAASANGIADILIHTGQHYDYAMSKVFFDEFGIKEPEYHLGVASGSHGAQTGTALQRIEEVVEKEKPDAVLVYGDTNSTLAGALAASKMHIPVVHVEAGLRSFNKYMPEEINRILTDHVSTVLVCPSATAIKNLAVEGIAGNVANGGNIVSPGYFGGAPKKRPDKNKPMVVNAGDIMYDVLLHAVAIAEQRSGKINELGIAGKEYCLLTVHRAENTDDPKRFTKIVKFVNEVSAGRTVIFPMHPRTVKMYSASESRFADNVKIIEPLGYFDILMVLKNAALALTDSGGMQKEAYWLKTPCVTLREQTEWVETVDEGWNVLYSDFAGTHAPASDSGVAYGDGNASDRIVDMLANTL